MAKTENIHALIEPAVEALGCQLWAVELVSQGKFSILRIYIDSENGINVDDCAAVSHQVSGILDVEDPIQAKYTLEVSSPGLDRPLYTLAQFKQYVGKGVKIKLRVPFDGRRKFTGLLTAIEGDDVVVLMNDEEYLLPIDTIDKANVVAELTTKG